MAAFAKTWLFFFVLYHKYGFSWSCNGIIWSKKAGRFVPLFSIPTFAAAKNAIFVESRSLETHNFHRERVLLHSSEDPGVIEFIENGTKITGYVGLLWTLISELANFTLIPTEVPLTKIGEKKPDGKYDGLLRIVHQNNETVIIPQMAFSPEYLDVVSYVFPLFKARYRLYVKPIADHDSDWIFETFPPSVWYMIAIFVSLSTFASYVCHKTSTNILQVQCEEPSSLLDYVFYNFAIFTAKGSVPKHVLNESKIIYMSLNIFSWFMIIVFSSSCIVYLVSKNYTTPFPDMKTLIQETDYCIGIIRDPSVMEDLRTQAEVYFRATTDSSRLVFDKGPNIYENACFSTKPKFAVFDYEERQALLGPGICRMMVVGPPYFEAWFTSGISKQFKYKRSFDIGIIKINECGLLRRMHYAQMLRVIQNDETLFGSIGMVQVKWIFSLLFMGMFASILIAVYEWAAYINLFNIIRENIRLKMQSFYEAK